MLRPMVSRPVCLGVKHPFGTYDQIFNTVRQMQVCWCGVLSLTRERVCHLQLHWIFQVKVTLWLTVSQSVSLGVKPHLGLMTRCLLLFGSYGLVFVGRPIWREDGSIFCICCWLLPAQSFSGPSPLGLATIFTVSYLRLPFSSPSTTCRVMVEALGSAATRVTEYLSQSQSYIMTDGQSASLSWNKAPTWGLQPDFYYC
jgi:hypothetical protein